MSKPLFLISACLLAWVCFVVGMMIQGIDPDLVNQPVLWVFLAPLLVLPAFNFSPIVQLRLVMEPASRYLVYFVFLVSCAVFASWAIGSSAKEYVVVFSSIWMQLIVLRFLVRRYYDKMGIYPGDVIFSPYGVGASENMKLPVKNRLYAAALFFLGVSQMTVLLVVE